MHHFEYLKERCDPGGAIVQGMTETFAMTTTLDQLRNADLAQSDFSLTTAPRSTNKRWIWLKKRMIMERHQPS